MKTRTHIARKWSHEAIRPSSVDVRVKRACAFIAQPGNSLDTLLSAGVHGP